MAAAVGGVVTEAVVDRLKARMFVPGSNNALADISSLRHSPGRSGPTLSARRALAALAKVDRGREEIDRSNSYAETSFLRRSFI